MAENVTRLSKAETRAAHSSFARVQVCGVVAGALVFCIILAIYFSALFAKRSLVRFGLRPLFKVFPAADGKTYGTKSMMENIYSHYEGSGSSHWAGYKYTGRMMLTDNRGGVGVIFLARRRWGEDCFYTLRRCGRGDTFFISGCGMEAKFAGRTDTEFSPKAQLWHRFKIQVEDVRERTEIRAKVWKDASPEPAEWQIDCSDVGYSRSSEGSVGVWACSEGEKYFDDLFVKPIYAETKESRPENSIGSESVARDSLLVNVDDDSEGEGRSGECLLRENFDRFRVGAHPEKWSDGLAPVDFSEAADTVSRFFRMNLLDFAGPWDEIVDWATIALTFCFAGFLAGIALKHRARILRSKTSTGWKWRIPFEFVPFVVLFVYDGAMKGVVVVLYAGAGLGAGYLWRFLHTLLFKLFPPPTVDRTKPTTNRSA